MCKGNHVLPDCSQFLALPITSRRSYARDHKLCYNCLGSNHSSSRCRSKTRCPHCRIRHHVLVHLDSPTPAAETNNLSSESPSTSQGSSLSIVSNHVQNEIRPSGILPTVVVQVADTLGNKHLCRVLLDTGSQASFVTESLVKRLHLRRRHARLPISGISSLEAGVTQGAVTLNLKSCVDSNEMDVEAFILNKITSHTPLVPLDFDKSLLLGDLKLADPSFDIPGPIDILIGSDKAWNILRDGRRTDKNGNIIAHNTIFGWVITGNAPTKETVSLFVGTMQMVLSLLKTFWVIEELPHNMYSLDSGDFADSHFCKTFYRAPDGKYVVELPLRGQDVSFSNTLPGALSRLFAMERRFARQEKLRLDYCSFMKTYQELGHMERIPESEIEPTSGNTFYLPHHAVVTNKLRVVFDGSHKDASGTSLNEMLHIGPPLQRNLINVCLRFRIHQYVFCADIVKMFRQIWVDKKHRDYQRIVWRENPNEPIGHYRLCTVTYGTSPAPFLSMRVLKQLGLDYKDRFPIASHSILHDFYVDDIMTGSDSVSGILELKKELIELLSCGGLQLSKWSSNCWPVLQGLDCEPTFSLDLDSAENCTKVLGLIWNPHRDIFTFKISLESSFAPTKRMLLSEIAKVFDPLGFLAPVTILFKMLFQELWVHETKIGWDDPLPRFSDASQKAYSAAVYIRSVSERGEIEVQLVAGKTRVAPVKQLTIPRLELCGALLLTRLIVLAWLSSPPRRWNTFISNRTAEILDELPRSEWNYIRSEQNPADCASRGVEPRKLLQLGIWWKGPDWLCMEFDSWPISAVSEELEEVPEMRKQTVVAHVLCVQEGLLDKLGKRVSSWFKVLRIVAVFVRRARNNHLPPEERIRGFFRSSELLYAKQKCLLWAQEEFSE
ncbi:uncharacterized protein LOC129906582 [Episyrphus balteatus]|uniref:uncharacterized protein LOC129906582 n=1 Tax=Episyrphus balteatus TaxID=286459 RepID=UPI0024869019|nr:uncharacterized protein LOC129906582 [Episyrphus balteatus]